METEVTIVNAFASNGGGGNPAAIVLDADSLTHDQKQGIAAQVGLSETAFVSSSKVADVKLEFFTPTRQIPHCGHATIATFSFLRQLGRTAGKDRLHKETIDGTREILYMDDKVFMEQRSPVFSSPHEDDKKVIISALGAGSAYEPVIVNTGNSFIVLEVESEAVLAGLTPDFKTLTDLSEKYSLVGFYVFLSTGPSSATTRMFAPAYGIHEESATGMAAGPLACYLDKFKTSGTRFDIEQGRYMEIPSVSSIEVRLEKAGNRVARLFAGGIGVVKEKRLIKIN